jgi:hypothetical protein
VITHTVKPRTWQRYEELVRLRSISPRGATVLSKLTAPQVQRLYAAKFNEGLSSTTVHHIHATAHRALVAALRLGLVTRNVADMVDAPRMRQYEMMALVDHSPNGDSWADDRRTRARAWSYTGMSWPDATSTRVQFRRP